MAKIINAQDITEERVKNGFTVQVPIYAGDAKSNLNAKEAVTYTIGGETPAHQYKSADWKNSKERFELYRDIKNFQSKFSNAAVTPSPDELATWYAKIFIDRQRLTDTMIDLQPLIATVINRADVAEKSYLRDYLPYIGKESVISGANDKVPLIDAKTATVEEVVQTMRAFGYKGSIKNTLFNPIPEMQRANEAAAIISTDYKNNDLMSVIIGATYGALHTQTADSTGSTYDLKLYNTLKKAYKTLGKLYHPGYTKRLVATMPGYGNNVCLLINPTDLWAISSVVNGFVGGGFLQNISPIPIKSIIPYGAGIMDGETYGKETLSLPGVTAGYAYMFLPGQSYVVTKRDTTMETGTGPVLELSTQETAWYRVSGVNTTWMIGGAATNTGFGTMVKIALPTES